MRQITVAEFIYILNGYNCYIWNFYDYMIEYYRRNEKEELWKYYMSLIPPVFYKELDSFYDLSLRINNNYSKKKTKSTSIDDIFNKINENIKEGETK